MGGVIIGILVWQEGGEYVGVLIAVGLVALFSLARWLLRREREGRPMLLDPSLFRADAFRLGAGSQMLQNIVLGGMMIALPIYLQMVLEYNALQTGLTIAPLSLTMFASALIAGRRSGKRRPAAVIRGGWALVLVGLVALEPIIPRAESGWALVVPLIVAGAGLGLLVSQLNNYTLSPVSDERVSEAAGVNSAAGSFGLSFGLAFGGAIMLATLSIAFTRMAEDSPVLPPAQQAQVAAGARGGRAGAQRHRSCRRSSRTSPTRSAPRCSPSTRTRGRSRCRWRSSSRSSPRCSGSSTGSGCCAVPIRSHPSTRR